MVEKLRPQEHQNGMPRRPRVVVPGVAHHITQRGNNRQTVFHTPQDRSTYLSLLSRYGALHGVEILAYCLMPNHVHLVLVPEGLLSMASTLRQTHSDYALRMNRLLSQTGHFWESRYFSCPLDRRHFSNAIRYVELNPVRAGLVAAPQDWPWSSAREHSQGPRCELRADDTAGWDALRRATQHGEPLGSAEFVLDLEERFQRHLLVGARGRPKQ